MGLSIVKRKRIIPALAPHHIGTNAQTQARDPRQPMSSLHYLTGYPEQIQQQAKALLNRGQLGDYLQQRYPDKHDIQGDKALFQYANTLKQQYLRKAPPLSKAHYDAKLKTLSQALGMHTRQTRIHGNKLRSHNSLRIASQFKAAPEAFLRMIVVHELAHFKETDHNKAFYQLCSHMAPDYHQLELDTRLWLLWQDTHNR